MSLRASILAALAILGIARLGVWLIAPSSVFTEHSVLLDGESLEMLVAPAGIWSPVLIVTFMTVGVVASRIPSASIALAAGAAYGHLWGQDVLRTIGSRDYDDSILKVIIRIVHSGERKPVRIRTVALKSLGISHQLSATDS